MQYHIQSKILIIIVALLLSSCDGGGTPKAYTYVLTNTPLADIKEGETYVYTPKFYPAILGEINFTIPKNQPDWISLDPDTGTISGTPSQANVGTYPNIEIQTTIGDKKLTTGAFSITVEDVNFSPTITIKEGSGIPKTTDFYATRTYTFELDASDQEKTPLEFFIELPDLSPLPDWISFDKDERVVSVQPEVEHIGEKYEITISVSDGTNQTYLQPFTFSVIPGIETATISWTAPTKNEDGTELEDLAGYYIYYGTKEGEYDKDKRVRLDFTEPEPHPIENLLLPEYFFVMTAFDVYGNESQYSNPAHIKID
ncbi:MAG: putative Ig domain-containing protein [Gammaproteobacteria bacterium]|nr:putative Ig domain-containing protein [Gammaproteobacteria bacterium]